MMLKKNGIAIVLLLFIFGLAFGQETLREDLLVYAAAHPPTAATGLEDIAHTLLEVAENETDQAIIAFYWIAEHIDYQGADDGSRGELLDLNQVIQQQKADVRTFSQLYRELCVVMGLTCHIVPGYIRLQMGRHTEYSHYSGQLIKRPERPEHTWNAVKVDGQYYFVDVSMGSSMLGGDLEEVIFIKKYDLSYVLVNEYPFVATHLPADPRWQMRDYPISMRTYYTDLSYEEMLEESKFSSPFDYKTAIVKYESAGDASQRLMRLKSTYEFYQTPFNARQLADAYYNIAYAVSQELYSDQGMMEARRYYQQAIDIYEDLDQTDTVKQLLRQAQQGITYVNYRLEHKQ